LSPDWNTGRSFLRSSCGKRQNLDAFNCRIESQLSAHRMSEDSPLANARINFLCGDVDAQFRAFLQAKEEEAAARLLVVSASGAPAHMRNKTDIFGLFGGPDILTLPPEVITCILYKLDGTSVLRISSVNKDLKLLCDEKDLCMDLWMNMLIKDFSVFPERLRNFTVGPKDLYKSVWKIHFT